MKILDEVIAVAIDDQNRLSMLLRKCLLLAHELKDSQLKDWVNHELNGYDAASALPDYRMLHIETHGNFVGRFGASLKNYPIPPAALEVSHRSFATELNLFQPISAFETASLHGDGEMSFSWPSNLCVYYRHKLYRGYVLVNAWQSVSKSTLVAVLESVRNRILNMALELKKQLGEALNLDSIPPSSIQKVHETIRQNIFYGPTYISSDASSITVTSNRVRVSTGNLKELEAALQASGLEQSDVVDLKSAMEADGRTLGAKVNLWIRQNAPKLLDGGVKLSASVAQTLLTDWLKAYWGIK